MAMATGEVSSWRHRRKVIFRSVFQTDFQQPTPYSTPSLRFSASGQPFGGPVPLFDPRQHHGPELLSANAGFARDQSRADSLLLHKQHDESIRTQPYAPRIGDDLMTNPPALTSSSTHPTSFTGGGSSGNSSSSSTLRALPPSPAPLFPSQVGAADDQNAYDRAWHVVTARILLPTSATAEDSFGTLAPESQYASQGGSSEEEFYEALRLVLYAKRLLPRATHTDDIVTWHMEQVRRHFIQHVLPLLSACTVEGDDDEALLAEEARSGSRRGRFYQRHMVVVMSSVRTLEAAMRLYSYGLSLLLRGFQHAAGPGSLNQVPEDAERVASRFRRDVHALVSNSITRALLRSLSIVIVRLVETILGWPAVESRDRFSREPLRPSPPDDNSPPTLASRQRLLELVEQLESVGLGGERFQTLFAEVMNYTMARYVYEAYCGVWTSSSGTSEASESAMAKDTLSRAVNLTSTSACLVSLSYWVENHFARLAVEVLSRVVPKGVSPMRFSDVKTCQALALGRLAALRIDELFDIVLAWPASRGALDDLRASINTPARRHQLTESFKAALQKRLLHPGCNTPQIVRTYIAIIRTFHALDNTEVLLWRVVPSLQWYLCQREDAVRIVVIGLLTSPQKTEAEKRSKQPRKEEGNLRHRRGNTPTSKGKPDGGSNLLTTPTASRPHRRASVTPSTSDDLASMSNPVSGFNSSAPLELAGLLNNEPRLRRRGRADEDELDWNDMNWMPNPVDAGANYRRPRSEDVVGTLITTLGSPESFIKEFTAVVAERLLGDAARTTDMEQELRVLRVLKVRFGDAALQNCDVMIRDVQDSRRLDAAIRRVQHQQHQQHQHQQHQHQHQHQHQRQHQHMHTAGDGDASAHVNADVDTQYHARILSRLFWPGLEREHFLLPPPVAAHQRRYEQGYERLKAGRRLAWLNQLGQARVELELRDRTVVVDCSTVEATVIYAFQDETGGGAVVDEDAPSPPVRRTIDELCSTLQMDEDAIVAALHFWTVRGILRRVGADTYVTAETLAQQSSSATGSSGADGAPATSTVKADAGLSTTAAAGGGGGGGSRTDAREQERRAMYWQYIRGMLTNASATMPLAQMAMMLKMLIAGGFPWSNEELQEFLAEKVSEGLLEVVGGKYRLVKK